MHSIPQSSMPDTAQIALSSHSSAASAQSLEGDYLLERWLPLLGPDKYALVCVLRSLCYQNPATDEFITEFSLDLGDLAAKIGKSRATVCRLLHRNAEGVVVEERKSGPPIPSLLNHFVQVFPQQRYSHKHGRRVQTINRFKVTWTIPPVPGEEASSTPRSSGSQNETLKTSPSISPAHQKNSTPACVCACPLAHERAVVENLNMRQQRSCSSFVAENITSNDIHRTIRERRPDRSILLKKDERVPSPEKALGWGEAGGISTSQHLDRAQRGTARRISSRLSRQPEQEQPTRFALALAEAERVAGGVLVDLLQQYGDPNPTVGMRTILVALVEAGAPHERLCDLAYLGRNRLRRFQLRGGHIQTTVPGYFINLMRNLASEAKGQNWETERIEGEDQTKHQDILRRFAARGRAPSVRQTARAETELEAAEEEAPAPRAATPEEPRAACVEEESPVVLALSEVDPYIAPDPAQYLPESVEVAEAALVATWQDQLPDPQSGQLRSVSMLWGFVRDEIRARSPLARSSQLEALTPKWDATRPRTLLLLCHQTYAARAAELTLRREIEPQLGKLLSDFFNDLQVVYLRDWESRA